jgi:hypothetical protein
MKMAAGIQITHISAGTTKNGQPASCKASHSKFSLFISATALVALSALFRRLLSAIITTQLAVFAILDVLKQRVAAYPFPQLFIGLNANNAGKKFTDFCYRFRQRAANHHGNSRLLKVSPQLPVQTAWDRFTLNGFKLATKGIIINFHTLFTCKPLKLFAVGTAGNAAAKMPAVDERNLVFSAKRVVMGFARKILASILAVPNLVDLRPYQAQLYKPIHQCSH